MPKQCRQVCSNFRSTSLHLLCLQNCTRESLKRAFTRNPIIRFAKERQNLSMDQKKKEESLLEVWHFRVSTIDCKGPWVNFGPLHPVLSSVRSRSSRGMKEPTAKNLFTRETYELRYLPDQTAPSIRKRKRESSARDKNSAQGLDVSLICPVPDEIFNIRCPRPIYDINTQRSLILHTILFILPQKIRFPHFQLEGFSFHMFRLE